MDTEKPKKKTKRCLNQRGKLVEVKRVDVAIQVVPGRAGGGSFRRKKTYIAKKEFAYRMCASRPTSAMPKPFLCCERAFCCSMVVMCRGGDLTCFDVMRSVAG